MNINAAFLLIAINVGKAYIALAYWVRG